MKWLIILLAVGLGGCDGNDCPKSELYVAGYQCHTSKGGFVYTDADGNTIDNNVGLITDCEPRWYCK